jgi:TonB-dependent starch-binding outer membrane protein SusC
MKITAMLFLISAGSLFATVSYAQYTKLTVQLEDSELLDIIRMVEDQSEFRFFYNENVKLNKKVSVDIEKRTVFDLLDQALGGTGVKYQLMGRQIALYNDNETFNLAILQQIRVSGKVTSSGGEPLPGVSVVIKGTITGTITNAEGNYSLPVGANEILLFTFVGMRSQEVPVSNRTVIDVVMEEETLGVEEVVVIGYGARRKEDITSSISVVESADLNRTNALSPDMAMQGRMPGVFVQSGSSEPFARPTVRIRGTNSWGVADPLYVIDGIPITEYGAGAESTYGAGAGRIGDLRSPVNVMTMINPNDIESISVLKDASAAAIYGVRAANGVVLITTKKGKSGAPSVEVNAKFGLQNVVNTYDVLNVNQYMALYTEMYANNPAELPNKPKVFDPASPEYLGSLPTNDWQKPFINENALLQDYNFKISGGNKSSNYYVSMGYNDTESAFIGSSQKRYSFATNINSDISSWMRTGVNYRYVFTDILDDSNNQFGGGNLMEMALSTPPWQPIYDPTGPGRYKGYMPSINYSYSDYPEGFTVAKRFGPETGMNRFGQIALDENTYKFMRNLGTAFLEIEPLSGLRLKGTISVDWYYQRRSTWEDVNSFVFNSTPSDPLLLGAPGLDDTIGSYSERHTRNTNIVKEFTLSYTKKLEEHHFDLLFNFMDQQYKWEAFFGGADQIPSRVKEFIPMNFSEREYNGIENGKDHYALQGMLGRVSYNFASRYYFDATVRRDGTSRFHPDQRWGTFPSASLAWRISSEPFMAGLSWITDMKLRAGWGKLGNQETAAFAYLSLVSRDPTYAFGSTRQLGDPEGIFSWGVALPSYPNADLTWESTETTNIGIDATLFENFDVSAEYYYKNTDGILQNSQLPTSVGNQNPPIVNIAQVVNKGFEFSGNYRASVGKLNLSVSGNLTTVDNEVVKMFNDAPLGDNLNRIEVGYPIYYLWGYKTDGIFKNQDEVNAYKAATTDKLASKQEPGDIRFKDVNGPPGEDKSFYTVGPDGLVNDYDRTYLGKTIPGYFYGINLYLEYSGFDIAAFFQGVGDVQQVNFGRLNGESMNGLGNNMLSTVIDRWTPSNVNADIPRAVAADPARNNRFSDRWVEDAGYLRFANLQIGYSLPTAMGSRLNLFRNARIWIGGSNLFIITPWSGLDPENDAVPTPRIFNLGIDVRF